MTDRNFMDVSKVKALLGVTDRPVEQLWQLADNRVVGAFQNAYLENVWTYAGVHAIITNIGGVPFKLRTTDRYGNPGADVVDRLNPWVRLFDNPSPTLDKTQLWKATSLVYELEGQVFWIFKKADGIHLCGEGEVPAIIEICGSRYVTPVNGSPDIPIVQWRYNRAGVDKVLENHQMLRFYDINPTSPHIGLSPTAVAGLSIGVDQKVHAYNDKFFKNGAQISGYLVDENKDSDLSETEISALLKRWNQQFNGLENSHKTPFLSNGVKFIQTGSSQKDMDFLNLSKTLREEICGALNVPKNQVGIFDGMNYANSKIADRQFFTNNLMPLMRYFASVVNNKLLYSTEYECYFDFSTIEPLKDDRDQRMRSAEVLFKLGYSLNEINSVLELSMTEIKDEWASEPVEVSREKEAVPQGGDVLPAGQAEPDTAHEPSASDERPTADKLPKNLFKALAELVTARQAPSEDEPALEAADFTDACVDPMSKAFRPKLVSLLTQLRNEQLKRLDRGEDLLLTDVERVLFDKAEWQAKYRASIAPFQADSARETASFFRKEAEALGLAWGEPVSAKDLADAIGSVTEIAYTIDNLWAYLQDSLKEAAQSGATMPHVKEIVRARFKHVLGLAPMIARTEMFKTANAVRYTLADTRYGAELAKVWSDSLDTEVRSSHSQYNKLGPQNLTFEYAMGLKFPGDPSAKAEDTIGCRCHITFVRAEQ